MGKSEIHTSEDFLDTPKKDICILKGFGEKTVDKLSAIILKAVENMKTEVHNKQEQEEDLKNTSTVEPVVGEIEID